MSYEDKDALLYLADVRIDELQSENAKLRELLDITSDMARDYDGDRRLLRKLVRDMVDYGEGAGNGMAEFFADRMRELGVEVDDA